MLVDIKSGKELENRVKSVLEKSGLQFKEQPLLTPFNLRFDFLVSGKSNQLFVMEVSKRNSNEDMQRLCFRSVICKEFNGDRIKTVAIVPSFNGDRSSLKFIGLMIKFFDLFLFEEDLELLPNLLNDKTLFFKLVKDKISRIQPDFGKILDLFKDKPKFLHLQEISELSGLRFTRVKDLIRNLSFNLETLGLIECFGNVCRLNERFLK